MDVETIGAVISRVQGIETDVASLRRTVDAEHLPASDHQYVSRCFDLLTMELDALRQYLRGLASP